MSGVEWLRPEFQDREADLVTRSDYEKLTREEGKVVTAQSLSSHFTRYADRAPEPVKRFGKTKWFLRGELDDFIAWIRENSGTRSEVDIKRAEIARLKAALEEVENRKKRHLESLAKAERDELHFRRKLRQAEDDLAFLKQGS